MVKKKKKEKKKLAKRQGKKYKDDDNDFFDPVLDFVNLKEWKANVVNFRLQQLTVTFSIFICPLLSSYCYHIDEQRNWDSLRRNGGKITVLLVTEFEKEDTEFRILY